jgi:hypothetical protein
MFRNTSSNIAPACVLTSTVLRRAGILHDVDATEKSIAAGGKNSVKGEFGVSNPYEIGGGSGRPPSSSNKQISDTSTLMEKINKIESISQKARAPVMTLIPEHLSRSCFHFRTFPRSWHCPSLFYRSPLTNLSRASGADKISAIILCLVPATL